MDSIQRAAREVTAGAEASSPPGGNAAAGQVSKSDEGDKRPNPSKLIEKHREEVYGAMAMIAVARDSVDVEDNYNLHRILDDTYDRLDKTTYTILDIGHTNGASAETEVAHGQA